MSTSIGKETLLLDTLSAPIQKTQHSKQSLFIFSENPLLIIMHKLFCIHG